MRHDLRLTRGSTSTLRNWTGQRGQVLVLFVIGAFVLIGAVGLGIDSSRTFEERRAAQTAVDHAATAAALASCTGSDEAASKAAGLAAAKRNGYDDPDASVNLTVKTDVTIIPLVGEADTFLAGIRSTIESTFARLLGINDFTVSVEATAGGVECGAGGSGPGAMYGGGTCEPGKGADLSGSDMTVEGSIHSNSDLKIAGSFNDYDEVTFVDDKEVSGSPITYAPGPPTYPLDVGDSLPDPQWPTGWDPSDADAAMFAAYQALAFANGTDYGSGLPPSTIDKDGVWFTSSTSEWTISDVDGTRNVVLVSQNGEIKLPSGNETLHYWDDPSVPRKGILILSGKIHPTEGDKCSKYSVQLSGQYWTWSGIIWAPGGLIELNGSDDATGNGSLVSWGVKISGQRVTIREDETLFESGDPSVLMLQ